MAGRYDYVPMDTSTTDKMLGVTGRFADSILSQADVDRLYSKYGAMEDQMANDSWKAAQYSLSEQFSPAFQAIMASRTGSPVQGWGGYNGGAGGNQMMAQLGGYLNQSFLGQLNARNESAARKAAYARELADRRIGVRSGVFGAANQRALTVKKEPGFWQKAANAGLQLAGSAIGAKFGGPGGGGGGGGYDLAGKMNRDAMNIDMGLAGDEGYSQYAPKPMPKYRY
jgi:hypothetical protein